MPADPDPLAAELAAIEQRQEHGSLREFATADSPRMLKALRRINALADQWYGERGNDYSASALYASRLREVLSEELLGSKEGRDDGSD
jgi:hypothetical protein